MENASKALLIAGAILLVLVIIGLSVGIFNRGSILVDRGVESLSQADIENHNAKFAIYEGVISGAEVKAACRAVAVNNDSNSGIEMTIKVGTITFPVSNESTSETNFNTIMNSTINTNAFQGKYKFNSKGIITQLEFQPVS